MLRDLDARIILGGKHQGMPGLSLNVAEEPYWQQNTEPPSTCLAVTAAAPRRLRKLQRIGPILKP